MQIIAKSVDDFKTDRKDISPPLQPALRAVPIAFFVAVIAGLLLNTLAFIQIAQAKKLREAAAARQRTATAEIEAIAVQKRELEKKSKEADDLAKWIDSSRPLQPLVVDIARSVPTGASFANLELIRDTENPSQIRLNMKLQGESPRLLDSVVQAIGKQGIKIFSPEQSVANGEIDYQSTLLWKSEEAPEEVTQ
jgi:hypothetical protein